MNNALLITKKLSDLKIGEVAVIDRIETPNRELRVKLQTFGLLNGTSLEVKSVAPLGDPITILVRGSSISLRKCEAEAVSVYYSAVTRNSENIVGLVPSL